MTTILVLGGTAWLGRLVARAAQAVGSEVTCLARGEAGTAPDGVRWVPADRSRSDAYDAVAGQDWDAVVDVSRQPGFVRSALAALADRTRHWTYVSSCSVYARQDQPGADESASLFAPLATDTATEAEYGPAKAAGERACWDAVSDRLLIARAGLLGGYGDRTDRFGYWPARFAAAVEGAGGWVRGAPVLVPAVPGHATQTLHAADLAAWLVRAGVDAVTGTLNAVGDQYPFSAVLDACREAVGVQVQVTAVDPARLAALGVQEYMGDRSLPLWIHDPDWVGFSCRDGSAARAAGLTCRPLAELVADALRWERELGLDRPRRAGLTPEQERDLLAS
ncbi:MAG: oxidoreductase [Angustibacter sp.]